MKFPNFASLCATFLLGTTATLFLSNSTIAAEKIVLKYGPLAQSIKISDLENFVKTGETTPTLATMLKISKQNADTVRGLMSLELGVNVLTLDRALNSKQGETALVELGKTMRTRSRFESDKALRAALILSSADNGKLSLIEILQKYPTSEINIEVANIGATVEKLKGLTGNLQQLLNSK
ncbi:hypothetical protein BCD67_04285 [Oscillatoriales cyanobacterium USR001]|nr:hypothetical protein BCD67_04285 [Oscillatoriales cyanobacterium USR001]